MKDHKDLRVWQKAMDLVVEVYRLVKLLPKEENFALANQMRRAVVSIPSNIAEGNARTSEREFLRFLSVAQGSNAELETQLLLCQRLNYIPIDELDRAFMLVDEIGRMLYALSNTLSG